jgi:hypothetical protein
LSESLDALIELPTYIEQALRQSREGLLKGFRDVFESNFGLPPVRGRLFIVTHGYSHTVEDVLKNGISGSWTGKRPHVFVLQLREDERAEAKMLDYELRECKAVRGTFESITVGDLEVFRGLLRPEDCVVMMLGAECVSAVDFRMVRARHTSEGLNNLIRLARKVGCAHKTVVVVDSYKLYENQSVIDEFVLNEFHFDRIAVTSGDEDVHVDAILGGNRILLNPRPAAATIDVSVYVDGVYFGSRRNDRETTEAIREFR